MIFIIKFNKWNSLNLKFTPNSYVKYIGKHLYYVQYWFCYIEVIVSVPYYPIITKMYDSTVMLSKLHLTVFMRILLLYLLTINIMYILF